MSDLSVKSLKKAQNIVNNDSDFRHLGNVDLTMGVKVGKFMCLITFEGFTCHGVRKITENEVREADFMIDMSQAQWDRFITGCQSGEGLNLAQLDSTDYIVKANDPRKKLQFLRYHTSIQAFFEAYAAIEMAPA